ncbi:MAG: FeoA family protein [Terricaulis sp.]
MAALISEPVIQAASKRLSEAPRGSYGRIMAIDPSGDAQKHGVGADELERRLLEIGFVEGACFEILHEGPIGRDPLVVRVDDTRIALRRREAYAILVTMGAL